MLILVYIILLCSCTSHCFFPPFNSCSWFISPIESHLNLSYDTLHPSDKIKYIMRRKAFLISSNTWPFSCWMLEAIPCPISVIHSRSFANFTQHIIQFLYATSEFPVRLTKHKCHGTIARLHQMHHI